VSEEKFSKCEEGKKKKKWKCRISGVQEKKEKFREKKKSKCFFWMKILLSSCSLFGVYINLQVEVSEKKKKFSKYISGGCLKVAIC
jgi:hypothetical protein